MNQVDEAKAAVPKPAEHRGPGRPRVPGTDAIVLRAAAQLLAEHGTSGMTVSAVAARAGVSRATVYRRWPTRDALIGAATREATAGRPFPLSGDIEQDIRIGARYAHRIYDSPAFVALLPEIVRALTADPPKVDFHAIGPNRRNLGLEYDEHATVQGFDPEIPSHLPFDMVFGALLGHLLATGKPAPPEYAEKVSELVVRGLRPRPEPEG